MGTPSATVTMPCGMWRYDRPRAVLDDRKGAVLQVERLHIHQVIMHHRVNAQVIGHGREHDMAQAEGFRDQIGNMGVGHVIQPHVGDALLAQAACQRLRRGLGIAVHRGIGDHNALFLRLVAAPVVVLVDEVHQILAPDRAVQRADTEKRFSIIRVDMPASGDGAEWNHCIN